MRAKEQLPLEYRGPRGRNARGRRRAHERSHLRADLLHGQKTGIFLDQRENYRAAAHYARGGKALDCFTSTGGFALHLAAKCESVEAVDSSARRSPPRAPTPTPTSIANIEFHEADVFDLLAGYVFRAARNFPLVVLDPPAFAKSRRNLEAAAPATRKSTCARYACSLPAESWSPAPAPTT